MERKYFRLKGKCALHRPGWRANVGLAAMLGIAIAGAVWYFLPAILLCSMAWTDEPDSRDAIVVRISACGPRAIPFIIRTVRDESPWSDYSRLPDLLGTFGETARSPLIHAIDGEPNPRKCAYLISALQTGFNDYRRLPKWVGFALAGKLSPWGLRTLGFELPRAWPDAPALLAPDGSIDAGFRAWWATSKSASDAQAGKGG
jgi:hypothetical protein